LKVVVQSFGFEAVQVVNKNSAALALVEEFTSKAPRPSSSTLRNRNKFELFLS
jgi:hypothetical protein